MFNQNKVPFTVKEHNILTREELNEKDVVFIRNRIIYNIGTPEIDIGINYSKTKEELIDEILNHPVYKKLEEKLNPSSKKYCK